MNSLNTASAVLVAVLGLTLGACGKKDGVILTPIEKEESRHKAAVSAEKVQHLEKVIDIKKDQAKAAITAEAVKAKALVASEGESLMQKMEATRAALVKSVRANP